MQFYKFYASSGFELEELSDYQLNEYLLTYQKLKRWVLYTGACILFCVLTLIYKPSKTLFAIPYFLSLFYLFFYAPILIYYFFNFASKHRLVAEAYAQRLNIKTQDEIVPAAIPTQQNTQLSEPRSERPNPAVALNSKMKANAPVQQLQDYISAIQANLTPHHNQILTQTIDIFEYIAVQKNQVSFSEFRKLNQHQELALKTVQESIEQYLCISADARDQYHKPFDAVPMLWLLQKLNAALEQLIQEIACLYQGDLQSLADHQQFLNQRFNPPEDDFKIETKSTKL